MSVRLDLDGITDIPPGKVAAIVTFYEVRQPPAPRPADARWKAERMARPVPKDRFRALYRRIGEDWLWFSHAVLDDGDLAALIDRPTTEVIVLKEGDADIGLTELDFATAGEAEIVTFGVVPEATGTGAAYTLMQAALVHAFAPASRPAVRRTWLHTCTHDHPAAVPFYRRWGFTPYRLAVEVADDPRLNGKLRRTAAPQVPLIER